VYDSPTGRAKLIPQGTRLTGVYDSQVAVGQEPVLLVWTRLIMLNGRSILLECRQGADAAGYSGLEDEVDNHWAELLKAALPSTILGVWERSLARGQIAAATPILFRRSV
jgi:type IV secretion system protein VirB10